MLAVRKQHTVDTELDALLILSCGVGGSADVLAGILEPGSGQLEHLSPWRQDHQT